MSNESNDTSISDQPDMAILNTLRVFNFWFLLVIIVVGLSGNVFAALAICTSPKLRRVSSNHYLVALALSDNVFLLGLFMIWLNKLGLPSYHHNEGACKFVLFLLNSSGCLSAWYVTVLTVERFIVVYYPLYRRAICSVGRTRRAIVGLVPWPVLFNVWVLFAGGLLPQVGICDILPEYYRLSLILNGVDMAVAFVVPVLVIVSFNVAICVRLWARDQKTITIRRPRTPSNCTDGESPCQVRANYKIIIRQETGAGTWTGAGAGSGAGAGAGAGEGTEAEAEAGAGSAGENLRVYLTAFKPETVIYQDDDMRKHMGTNAKAQKQERKITQTLLVISFVYVALNLPSYSVRLRDSVMAAAGATADEMSLMEKIIRNLLLLIYYTNFAINFVVYSLSSKNFRDAVKNVWKRNGKAAPNTSTGGTGYSYANGKCNRLIPSPSPSPCTPRSSVNMGTHRTEDTTLSTQTDRRDRNGNEENGTTSVTLYLA